MNVKWKQFIFINIFHFEWSGYVQGEVIVEWDWHICINTDNF